MWEEVKTITMLIDKGYTEDYRIHGQQIVCLQSSLLFRFNDFAIDEIYPFRAGLLEEVCLDICAITNSIRNTKGILIVFYHKNVFTSIAKWFEQFILLKVI